MRIFILLALILAPILPLTGAISQERENLPRKLKAAEDVIANLDFRGALTRNLPSAQSNPALAAAAQRMDFQAVQNQALNLMMAHFTEAELVAFAAFQATPEGKSMAEKMPKFQQYIGTVMREKLIQALENNTLQVPQR